MLAREVGEDFYEMYVKGYVLNWEIGHCGRNVSNDRQIKLDQCTYCSRDAPSP